MNSNALIADEIIRLYETFGKEDYIGEPVSQLEHMCQAAQLAELEGYDEEVILAAFFHDIGHLCEHGTPVESMDGYGVKDHEQLGAYYLRSKGFSEKIVQLVQAHVEAKRYLTRRYPAYYERLSEASRKTLEFQGGRMSEAEAADFENRPWFSLFIKMREWDDNAKLEYQPLPPLDHFRRMIIRHLLAPQV
ncbi:MAG TPA: HDIG domain-containing protein [Chitinophaga sp.]